MPKTLPKSSSSFAPNDQWDFLENAVYMYTSPTFVPTPKIAAFDMDHTLIKPKNNALHPKNRQDWEWFSPQVPEKLKDLVSKGYCIVVFTNQSIDKPEKGHILEKIQDISLQIPLTALVAVEETYQKPCSLMWTSLLINAVPDVCFIDSFYVGDAAGRKYNSKKQKDDFSSCDFGFALNVFGLTVQDFFSQNNNNKKFMTPEHYFLGQPEHPFSVDFDPAVFLEAKRLSKEQDEAAIQNLLSFSKEEKNKIRMILMVGPPGSSKSTFVENYLVPLKVVSVNRDTLKTAEKCLKEAERALSEQKSVVIDNTNPGAEARKEYIALAKKHNVAVHCFMMEACENLDLSKHLNKCREAQGGRHVPKIAYNMFKSKYEAPSKAEGIDEIFTVPFLPNFSFSKKEDFLTIRI